MRRFPRIAWMLLVLALCGCESADEKAERLRLENLYALNDLKVAQAYKKSVLGVQTGQIFRVNG